MMHPFLLIAIILTSLEISHGACPAISIDQFVGQTFNTITENGHSPLFCYTLKTTNLYNKTLHMNINGANTEASFVLSIISPTEKISIDYKRQNTLIAVVLPNEPSLQVIIYGYHLLPKCSVNFGFYECPKVGQDAPLAVSNQLLTLCNQHERSENDVLPVPIVSKRELCIDTDIVAELVWPLIAISLTVCVGSVDTYDINVSNMTMLSITTESLSNPPHISASLTVGGSSINLLYPTHVRTFAPGTYQLKVSAVDVSDKYNLIITQVDSLCPLIGTESLPVSIPALGVRSEDTITICMGMTGWLKLEPQLNVTATYKLDIIATSKFDVINLWVEGVTGLLLPNFPNASFNLFVTKDSEIFFHLQTGYAGGPVTVKVVVTPIEFVCSGSTPISCEGVCVSDIAECVQQPPCPSKTPFQCSNGTCVTTLTECTSEICQPGQINCWDGTCRSSLLQCPLKPTCPLNTPKRCIDGCVTLLELCPTSNCTGTLCQDGTCSYDGKCPEYNGCPLILPIQCPNGRCALLQLECECEPGKYLCFDGSCQSDPLQCIQAPFQEKPFSLDLAFSASETVEFTIPTHSSSKACTVRVFNGTVSTGDTDLLTLHVRPVADSIIRSISFPAQTSDIDYTNKVFSPVLDLSFYIGDLYVKEFYKNVTISCNLTIPTEYKTKGNLCLAYINSKNEWECVDSDMKLDESGFMSGSTNHFSSFAILLESTSNDETNGNEEVGRKKSEGLNSGIVIGVVVGAVAVVIIGSILGYFMHRKKKSHEEQDLQLENMNET